MEKIVKLLSANDDVVDDAIVNDIVEMALTCLKANQVIAVPTDTIYGIACLAQSSIAVESIYELKNRQREKAIAICVGSIDDVKRWGVVTVADSLLHDLLPGPVTLIFKRAKALNPILNPATDSIGIRIPDHAFIQRLAQKCGQPIALTSANISSAQSTLRVEEFEDLWPRLALVVDGGTLGNSEGSRAGSTVVDLSTVGEFTIVRDGCDLENVLRILTEKHGLIQRGMCGAK